MKKIIVLLSLCLILLALVPQQNPNLEVKNLYTDGLSDMLLNTTKLEAALESQNDALPAYFALRNSFKRIEFLLAQVDKEFYLRYYNGAPLPKLEKNVAELRVIEPKGLQVLDELLVEENLDKAAIKTQLALLTKHLNQSLKLSKGVLFTDELILHAMQYQWIRDYTQGLVGFDTPGSLRAIEDALQSIYSMKRVAELLGDRYSEFQTEAALCSLYLTENKNFDLLDRAVYYKLHWQPAYEKLISVYSSGVKTWSELSPLPKEVNPLATHLFSDTFFNVQAFIDFNKAELSPKTIALGERLFYDTQLSNTGKMACASCHNPEKAFTDGRTKSIATDGKSTLDRNSPTLLNSIYTKGFFYDLRSPKLSQQFEHVVFNEKEFNTSLIAIFSKLESDDSYRSDFEDAFVSHKKNLVNNYTFKTALAAYIASLRGYDSKWDKYMRGEGKVSADAIAGYSLFTGKAACATCHFAPTFAGLLPPYYDDSETEVLGVPLDTSYSFIDSDLGRFSPQRPKEMVDFYKNSFKTTTARHTEHTAPYMHNGVFATMEEVIDFYDQGGGTGRGLDVPYQTLASDSLSLSELEKDQLLAFLQTLN